MDEAEQLRRQEILAELQKYVGAEALAREGRTPCLASSFQQFSPADSASAFHEETASQVNV